MDYLLNAITITCVVIVMNIIKVAIVALYKIYKYKDSYKFVAYDYESKQYLDDTFNAFCTKFITSARQFDLPEDRESYLKKFLDEARETLANTSDNFKLCFLVINPEDNPHKVIKRIDI